MTLTGAEIRGLTNPGVRSAMADLAQRTGRELDGVEILAAESVTWSDASLGCPEPGMFYAQALTDGMRMHLLFQREKFDYRISGNHGRLCENAHAALDLEVTPVPEIWTRLADMPTSRGEVAVAEVGGKIYVMGGFGAGATAMEEYDPATNTWQKKAQIPRGVDHPAAGRDGQVYLIGGLDGRWGPVDNVWAYDPKEDSWTAKARMPTARGALAAVVLDGKIYAMGGRNALQNLGANQVYDPATDSWQTRSDLPAARDHLAAAAIGSRIYATDGRLLSFSRNLPVTEEYDPVSDRWTEQTPLSKGVCTCLAGKPRKAPLRRMRAYDPSSGQWSTAADMPTARHGIGAVALGNRIYVMAGGVRPGGSSSPLNEVFIVLGGLSSGDSAKSQGKPSRSGY